MITSETRRSRRSGIRRSGTHHRRPAADIAMSTAKDLGTADNWGTADNGDVADAVAVKRRRRRWVAAVATSIALSPLSPAFAADPTDVDVDVISADHVGRTDHQPVVIPAGGWIEGWMDDDGFPVISTSGQTTAMVRPANGTVGGVNPFVPSDGAGLRPFVQPVHPDPPPVFDAPVRHNPMAGDSADLYATTPDLEPIDAATSARWVTESTQLVSGEQTRPVGLTLSLDDDSLDSAVAEVGGGVGGGVGRGNVIHPEAATTKTEAIEVAGQGVLMTLDSRSWSSPETTMSSSEPSSSSLEPIVSGKIDTDSIKPIRVEPPKTNLGSIISAAPFDPARPAAGGPTPLIIDSTAAPMVGLNPFVRPGVSISLDDSFGDGGSAGDGGSGGQDAHELLRRHRYRPPVAIDTASIPADRTPESSAPSAIEMAGDFSLEEALTLDGSATDASTESTFDRDSPPRLQLPAGMSAIPLEMQLATARTLVIGGDVQDVRVINDAVCQACADDEGRIKLVGTSRGVTQLVVWAKVDNDAGVSVDRVQAFEVTVDEHAEADAADQSLDMLDRSIAKTFPGAEVVLDHLGDTIRVRGTCDSESDAKRILRMIRRTCLIPVEDQLVVQ